MFRFVVIALLAACLLAFRNAYDQDNTAQKALEALTKTLDTTDSGIIRNLPGDGASCRKSRGLPLARP
ncbi:hypothetical protein GTA51_19195 [Desulfovibrio aerotolerans]|uniref:Uncharacterized protein n=1 Tax=Solidesulfovibrio aerotolerans TaxID=295255 RepID=A0A7C9IU18_9BACT|nr:hypothetical protein [Solidesulfovibrio aerotolerans]MYL85227.1 hypothetical protein [Solidesulfovibrio aerotolerans]